MSITARTANAIRVAFADLASSKEVLTVLNAAAASSEPAQALNTTDSPTFAALTLTGDATVGGFVAVPTGKGVKVNNIQVVGAQQAAVVPVAVTFTANAPATYATPTGLLTVADGTTPTVVELLKFCDELRGNIVALQAVLHAHGLTA